MTVNPTWSINPTNICGKYHIPYVPKIISCQEKEIVMVLAYNMTHLRADTAVDVTGRVS